MKSRVNEELKQNFRPEFLNRVDEVIVFPQLTREELISIIDMFIARLDERLDDRDLKLTLTTAAKEKLIDEGYEPSLGARPLRRVVQREIEDQISERILSGEVSYSSDILVDFVNGEFIFTVNQRDEQPVQS